MPQLTVRDEQMGPQRTRHEAVLELPDGPTTVRELITQRVKQEVATFNASRSDRYNGLVQPAHAEATLNGPRVRRKIDAGQQIDAALEAFTRTRLIVLVDDRQVEHLDERIDLRPETRVSFVKLVPLAGG